MEQFWFCLDCPEHGKGDRGSEKHTKVTKHPTMTTIHESLAIKMASRTLTP